MLYRPSTQFTKETFSSQTYFQSLLDLPASDWLHESFSLEAKSDPDGYMDGLLAGYVTSADTGNEDLVIASRAALTTYCEKSQENLDRICTSLFRNMKAHQGLDRVIVQTLEIIAFLLFVGIYQRATTVDVKGLCLQVQKAAYKSGNVRKLEACVKVYGGMAAMGNDGAALAPMANVVLEQKRTEGIAEARRRLGALMIHPWPRIRSSVVDVLWSFEIAGSKTERLKGVDWGVAEKGSVKTLLADLDLL